MEFTGIKSDKAETIVLRGTAYHDFWYKVIFPGRPEGWVFSGAVKRRGEQKENAPITEMQFDYQKLGKYDLSTWQLINKEELGHEVDGTKTTFMSGRNLYLNITNPGIGKFGNGLIKSLSTDDRDIKNRNFHFTPSSTSGELDHKIETLEEYEQTSPKRYTIIQKIDTHYFALNAKPMIALRP